MVSSFGTAKRSVGFDPLAIRAGALRGREVPARPGIARRLARHTLKLAGQIQLLRSAEARIGAFLGLEPPEQPVVPLAPLRLRIRSGGSAHVRPFIPIEAQPLEIPHQCVAKARLAALDIRIFDAQNESTPALAGPQIAEKSGARVAEVQRSRG